MVKDPVCGMMVDPETAEFRGKYLGTDYYFCSSSCKVSFEKEPARYLKKKGWFGRFLDWLAQGNQRQFGNEPPKCCGQ